MKRLVEFLATHGITDAKAVCGHHIEAFTRYLAENGYKGKTLASYLIRIRVYFEFLESRKTIFLSPTAGLKLPRYDPGHYSAYDNGTLLSLREKGTGRAAES